MGEKRNQLDASQCDFLLLLFHVFMILGRKDKKVREERRCLDQEGFFQNTYFVRRILGSDAGIPIRKNTYNTNVS